MSAELSEAYAAVVQAEGLIHLCMSDQPLPLGAVDDLKAAGEAERDAVRRLSELTDLETAARLRIEAIQEWRACHPHEYRAFLCFLNCESWTEAALKERDQKTAERLAGIIATGKTY